MKVQHARTWSMQAGAWDTRKADLVLRVWHAAIEKAAKAGRLSVIDADVGTVRTPIPEAARLAALGQLVRDGFTVVEAGGVVTVSWATF